MKHGCYTGCSNRTSINSTNGIIITTSSHSKVGISQQRPFRAISQKILKTQQTYAMQMQFEKLTVIIFG